jgi:hypothetical protein
MQKIKPTYAITMALISLTSYTMPATAQSDVASNNRDRLRVHFVQQPQLPDNGAPTGRRKGAAGRGNCATEPRLTALVPAIEKNLTENGGKATYVWGKTSVEYPTFWFYVPYSPTSLRSVQFVLQDGEDDVYRTPVTLPKTPGIVSLRLPSTVKPLEVGKMYHWFFKVNIDCAPQQLSHAKDYVEGWVQRVELNPIVTRQLETATPQQRIAIYAENGIWHEALTMLADLRLVEPQAATLKDDWTKLLQSAGLSDIASKPIVQCCNLKNTYSFQGIRKNVNP